jgi:glycosyltransferase involved in cell wall biosynthesis
MAKIFMHRPDDWAQGYYRATAPVYNCFETCAAKGVHLTVKEELQSDEVFYNAYIFHRLVPDSTIHFIKQVKEMGKKVVWSLDDDLWSIPDYSPTQIHFANKGKLTTLVNLADKIMVSTPNLADQVQQPDKVVIAPNLADTSLYDGSLYDKIADSPLRILWAGSVFHDEDLNQIVNPIMELMEEFEDEVTFIFFGYLPTPLADFVRNPGANLAQVTAKNFGIRLSYIQPIEFKYYFDQLMAIKPHIGLAPLVENVFNNSKSGCKFFEYSLAGAATIAVNMPPYSMIEHGKTGLLVEPGNEEEWKKAIRELVHDAKLRKSLAKNAKQTVIKNHSWQHSQEKQKWVDFFTSLAS